MDTAVSRHLRRALLLTVVMCSFMCYVLYTLCPAGIDCHLSADADSFPRSNQVLGDDGATSFDGNSPDVHSSIPENESQENKAESTVNNGNATRRLPQALIIGVKKGGTRALLEFIRLHPDVKAVGPETHFFDRHYDRGLEWYRSQMPPTLPGQITMEKTPSYFVTKDVPRRIYNMSREVKLLVVVRDPVTRAISDYTQTASKRPEIKSFEELAFLNNTSGLVDTTWSAVKIGVYAKHLQRWLQYFPLQQFHFVSGELLIKDPAGQIALMQDFLGLRRVITEDQFYFSETKGFPCLRKWDQGPVIHCLGKTKGRIHPKISNRSMQRLRDFYRPFNTRFYQMTNIDFGWS